MSDEATATAPIKATDGEETPTPTLPPIPPDGHVGTGGTVNGHVGTGDAPTTELLVTDDEETDNTADGHVGTGAPPEEPGDGTDTTVQGHVGTGSTDNGSKP